MKPQKKCSTGNLLAPNICSLGVFSREIKNIAFGRYFDQRNKIATR